MQALEATALQEAARPPTIALLCFTDGCERATGSSSAKQEPFDLHFYLIEICDAKEALDLASI